MIFINLLQKCKDWKKQIRRQITTMSITEFEKNSHVVFNIYLGANIGEKIY